jgi:predicted RND superfamily exporter protein
MLSPFTLNSDMGMLTSIVIVIALAVDFLFLPPFLMAFDRKNIK